MIFAAVDPLALLSAAGILVGLIVAGPAVAAILRTNTTKASVEIMVLRNQEMRAENADLRDEVKALRGKVDLLTSGLAKELAHQFGNEIRPLVEELRKR